MDLIFYFEHSKKIAEKIAEDSGIVLGQFEYRRFPDQESYVRVLTDVSQKRVGIVCGLEYPDAKFLPLYFLATTLKALGASHVTLIAPYLSYMRQDKQFHSGEAVTSESFGALVSSFIDQLITIDPHLHRHHDMSELYRIPTHVIHAAPQIALWIKNNVKNPVLVGPDSESEQWVADVADRAGCPYVILQKIRHGDRDIEQIFPQFETYQHHTPVLVDDIISTAQTMIKTVRWLKSLNMTSPICIGVHGVFAGQGYEELKASGAGRIVTTNSIEHVSNGIEMVSQILLVLNR